MNIWEARLFRLNSRLAYYFTKYPTCLYNVLYEFWVILRLQNFIKKTSELQFQILPHTCIFSIEATLLTDIIILFEEHQEPETPADKPNVELSSTIVRFTSDSPVYRKQLKVRLFSDLQCVFVSRLTEDTCLYLSVCRYLVGRIVQFDTFHHHDDRKMSVFQSYSYS
jgi:hypothetical protein